MYRKKPVVIEAHQWWKNGDHPDDYKNPIRRPEGSVEVNYPPSYQKEKDWEGQVVRRFRTPDSDGKLCEKCTRSMNDHGWIDTLEGGHIVCPGDWIITGVAGERYPCKPDIFEATYEKVEEG